MYSPKIYEGQIRSLYYASQHMGMPMTHLANAFIYNGLANGQYGHEYAIHLPAASEVLPRGIISTLPSYSIGLHVAEGQK